MIARVFPAHRVFVRKVIAEGIEPASDFPFGPYPNDKLTYKNKEMVEYETPAHRDGLGTQSRVQKNADSIRGVTILAGEEPNLLFLAMRLPYEMNDLTHVIVQQVERETVADTAVRTLSETLRESREIEAVNGTPPFRSGCCFPEWLLDPSDRLSL